MQPGSLVECIQFCSGRLLINGEFKRAVRDIFKGETLTVIELVAQYNEMGATGKIGLEFVETGKYIHPYLNKPCGYPVDHFREIQPPINVSINGIIKQTSEA